MSREDKFQQRQREQAVRKNNAKKNPGVKYATEDSDGLRFAPEFDTLNPDLFLIKDFDFSIINDMARKLRQEFLHGDFTVTGRFRSREDNWDAFRYGDRQRGQGSREEDHYSRIRQMQRKLEEGDAEARHQIPPLERAREAIARYGHEKVLRVLIDILEDQEDLENFMDIVEPDLEALDWRNEPNTIDPYPARPLTVEVCSFDGGDHHWREVTVIGDAHHRYKCLNCDRSKIGEPRFSR